jgi:hypothetical protein
MRCEGTPSGPAERAAPVGAAVQFAPLRRGVAVPPQRDEPPVVVESALAVTQPFVDLPLAEVGRRHVQPVVIAPERGVPGQRLFFATQGHQQLGQQEPLARVPTCQQATSPKPALGDPFDRRERLGCVPGGSADFCAQAIGQVASHPLQERVTAEREVTQPVPRARRVTQPRAEQSEEVRAEGHRHHVARLPVHVGLHGVTAIALDGCSHGRHLCGGQSEERLGRSKRTGFQQPLLIHRERWCHGSSRLAESPACQGQLRHPASPVLEPNGVAAPHADTRELRGSGPVLGP